MSVATGFSNGQVWVPETFNKIQITSPTWENYEYVIEPNILADHIWKLQLKFSSSVETNNVVDIDDLIIEEIQVVFD